MKEGTVVRETPKFYVVDTTDGYRGRGEKRRKKSFRYHTEPCDRCWGGRDYPNGYMD